MEIERYHEEMRKQAGDRNGRVGFDIPTAAPRLAKLLAATLLPGVMLPSSNAMRIVLEKLRRRFSGIDRLANSWESGALSGPDHFEAHLNFLERITPIAHLEIDQG